MKTIICSDTHLTSAFDSTRFAYLQELFTRYDQIILNGDFWDGYETRFEKFAQSKWNALFPLLLKKNAVYIYGNHDKEEWTKRPEIFSAVQTHSYSLQVGKTELLIRHGHQYSPSFDITYPKLSYILSSFFSSKRFQFGNKVRGWENMQMKHFARNNLKPHQILVCGHSHIPENSKKEHYINSGFIENGIASYVSIIGTTIKLITETYG